MGYALVDGWYELTSPDREVYVSAAGNDSNDGLSSGAPKLTVAAGAALIRDGQADHLLLRKGDDFSGQNLNSWTQSGTDGSNRILIGSYGTGARPIIDGLTTDPGSSVSHVAIIGIDFAGSGDAISWRQASAQSNVLIEDCHFHDRTDGIDWATTTGGFTNLEIRRCVFGSVTNLGIYMIGVATLLLEECVFDQCGTGAGQRGVYIDNENPALTGNTEDNRPNFLVRKNIITRETDGLELRCGGTLTNNLVVQCDYFAAGTGSNNNSTQSPDGVDIDFSDNVIMDWTDVGSTARAFYTQNVRNLELTGNVCTRNNSSFSNGLFLQDTDQQHSTPDLYLESNIFYDCDSGAPSITMTGVTTTHEENNVYSDPGSWTVSGTNREDTDVTYNDPTRSVESYMASMGETATLAAFATEARLQSKDNWRSAYTAETVNNYIRNGFLEGSAVATFNKINQFVEDVMHGVHDFSADQIVVALTAAANAPVATNTVLANLTQIAYTNLSSRNVTTASSSETAGTYALSLTDLVLTASGAVATFRYVAHYNDTPTSPADPLMNWYDYGGDVTLANGETFTIDYAANFLTLA